MQQQAWLANPPGNPSGGTRADWPVKPGRALCRQARLTVARGCFLGLREHAGLLLAWESAPKLSPAYSMPRSIISSTLKLCPCSLACHCASMSDTTMGVDPGGGGARCGGPTCLEAAAAAAGGSPAALCALTLACTQTRLMNTRRSVAAQVHPPENPEYRQAPPWKTISSRRSKKDFENATVPGKLEWLRQPDWAPRHWRVLRPAEGLALTARCCLRRRRAPHLRLNHHRCRQHSARRGCCASPEEHACQPPLSLHLAGRPHPVLLIARLRAPKNC